jgi:diguanylate cyclase (GGDEF)-like protein
MNRLSTPLLVEFLAAVSRATDADGVCRAAVERAADSVQAEVAAVLLDGRVVTSIGFPRNRVPAQELLEAAHDPVIRLDVPGAGPCETFRAEIGGAQRGHLLLARIGEDPFTVEEMHLVRGMARVLELTLGTLRTLAKERALHEHSQRQARENAELLATLWERQRLLEQLSRIQRAISRRDPLPRILKAIATGAQELLADEVVMVELMSAESRDYAAVVASVGVPEHVARRLWRGPQVEAGRAAGHLTSAKLQAALAAPVHENGVVVGSLTIASRRPDRVYSPADHDMLRSFADQVSLAVTDAKMLEQMQRAYHDSLTGLASRKLFLEQLDHELTSGDSRVAVLFVDLDRFKQVNDSLGHTAGDELLIEVAERLRASIRTGDVAARLGGDEFAILLSDTGSPEPAEALADRILFSLSRRFVIAGREVFIDASIGIALGAPRGDDAESLVRKADLAMYEAKRSGKGCHRLFARRMEAALADRVQLDSDLRHVLDRDELILLFQPIVALGSGRIVGFEALLRWRHPRRGVLVPSEFIPFAEESGLILPLGRWITYEACVQAARWNAARPADSPLFVSVNLSTREWLDAALLDHVASALRQARLAPSELTLEITETLLSPDAEPAIAVLRRLSASGVKVALDDFGTGYSSLVNLRRLPIDTLKIESSFIADAPGDPTAAALVRSVVDLGTVLGLTTVAEGIEDNVQLELVRALGCDLGQGLYFSAPVTADQVPALLNERPGLAA